MIAQKVHPSVSRIAAPFHGGGTVYLYLVVGEQVALIDSGAADSPEGVLGPALEELGMKLGDVGLVLNTHGHLDHAGGNAAMRKAAPKLRILMHEQEIPLATDLLAEIEFHTAPLRGLEFPQSAIEARGRYVAAAAGQEKTRADGVLADGDEIDLGGGVRLRAVHVPGHTPGHLAFHWEAEGMLFAADAIQGQGSRPGSYPYYFDAVRYRQSLTKMAALRCETLCLSHAFVGGGPISDPTRQGAEVEMLLNESMRVADAIQAAVSSAAARMPESGKREIALEALRDLVYEVPQLRLRETDMPSHSGPSLWAHIEAAMAGNYPS